MSEQPNFVASERFADALRYAYELHRGQGRKGSGIPYLGHVLGVCALVLEAGGDEDQAIAGLLHDGPEDQGGLATLEEIRQRFGDRVGDIVAACSDTFETPKPPWRERKQAYLEKLRDEPLDVLLVSLADKVFNARAILGDLRAVGDDLWDRFRGGRDGTLWYYGALADVFAARLPGPLRDELTTLVQKVNQLASGLRSQQSS